MSDVRPGQPRPISLMSVTPVSLTRERKGSNARARESRKRRAREAGAARGDAYWRLIVVRRGQPRPIALISVSFDFWPYFRLPEHEQGT